MLWKDFGPVIRKAGFWITAYRVAANALRLTTALVLAVGAISVAGQWMSDKGSPGATVGKVFAAWWNTRSFAHSALLAVTVYAVSCVFVAAYAVWTAERNSDLIELLESNRVVYGDSPTWNGYELFASYGGQFEKRTTATAWISGAYRDTLYHNARHAFVNRSFGIKPIPKHNFENAKECLQEVLDLLREHRVIESDQPEPDSRLQERKFCFTPSGFAEWRTARRFLAKVLVEPRADSFTSP